MRFAPIFLPIYLSSVIFARLSIAHSCHICKQTWASMLLGLYSWTHPTAPSLCNSPSSTSTWHCLTLATPNREPPSETQLKAECNAGWASGKPLPVKPALININILNALRNCKYDRAPVFLRVLLKICLVYNKFSLITFKFWYILDCIINLDTKR